jgi:hypothetical protein
MAVKIHGTHTETRHSSHTDGEGHTRHTTETVTVTDFSFSIDATPFVTNQWSRIVCLKNGSECGTWKDILADYTASGNKLKEYRELTQDTYAKTGRLGL